MRRRGGGSTSVFRFVRLEVGVDGTREYAGGSMAGSIYGSSDKRWIAARDESRQVLVVLLKGMEECRSHCSRAIAK